MSQKAKITAKLETSDHDGYCSGEECKYEVKIQSFMVNLPIEYKNYPKDNHLVDWDNLLPVPIFNDGLYCCKLNDKCKINELGKHDYKCTIISVEIKH